MKITINILGVIAVLFGALWILQALNIVPGRVMAGHMQWAYIGAVLALIGIVLLVFANRPKAKT
ncbi:MAG: hypothetical protein ACHP7N_14725 [Caulobacterales bacterium]